MPTIDPARGVLVIRIVYDGPALSGKTTSLRALARGVARSVECPGERDGRTLFFDWLDYVGGIFEGRQIRCQIVSVPGQRQLAKRRKVLLESADAVVCVLDTRAQEIDFGLEWLSELCAQSRSKHPPVGVVLQANKRDASDAVPFEQLRARANAIAPVAIVESVARASDGIREAFVFAVRLALDRVRALSAEGRLAQGAPQEEDAAALLQRLEAAETVADIELPPPPLAEPSAPAPELLLGKPVDTKVPLTPPPRTDSDEGELIFVPDPGMPGGMIWPPVDGRALLHEVANLHIRPSRTPRGEWWGSGSGFRFHSSAQALYEDPNRARVKLIERARLHAANAEHLSAGRAVILADAGNGRLRLWQLVRVEPVLRERLATVMGAKEAQRAARGLLEIATQLLAARERFSQGATYLPCTLWTVGAAKATRPIFVGLMPDHAHKTRELDARALLERELTPHLREMRRSRVDYAEIFALTAELAAEAPADEAVRCLSDVVASFD